MRNRNLKLCVVSHFAYGALSAGGTGRLVGGVEWQTSLTARWMAARGHAVSILTWDEGQSDDEVIAGVRVIKICRRDRGLPGLRFFHPRWSGLVRAMKIADADVYYHNCGEYVTGQVAAWCRLHKRAFVYSVASDPDCDPRLPEMKTLRERVLYRYGLRHASRIIVQTARQQEMLRIGFGLDSQVIPMPCVGPAADSPPAPHSGPPRVAWVGRIVPLKRLEWLLDIAERLPDVRFDVVGPPDPETDYTRGLFERGRKMANVTMHGRVDRSRMPDIYRAASLLCCTSEFEGFPNTFLEAFSHGVPVVTTIDPDGVVAKHGLGAVADDVAALAAAIDRFAKSSDEWKRASDAARRYFAGNHALEVVMPRFEQAFVAACEQVRPRIAVTA
ncbi:MAG: glycosyltransferase family 4 protein [Planctomycetes bacterium]|nr:glycosyltransferase family 4 protein [Planctomycetota bacterium]